MKDRKNIYSLDAKRREPNASIVETLRRWLEGAERGDVQCVVLAGEVFDDQNDMRSRMAVAGTDGRYGASLAAELEFWLRMKAADEEEPPSEVPS